MNWLIHPWKNRWCWTELLPRSYACPCSVNQVLDLQNVSSHSADIFSLRIGQVPRRINIRVAGSTGELILYFKWFLKTWVGKLSRNSVARVYFTCLRRRTKPRRAQLKLFSSGGTFRLSWVPQPIESVSINESWKLVYDSVINFQRGAFLLHLGSMA